MQCKRKYQWVKLPRCCLPQGKGVLGQWARLAARAAYRKGTGRYCGFENPVEPGMWAGGVVGLKSILGVKSRQAALGTLKRLQEMGYLRYTLDPGTKKLEYRLTDWVAACTGEACRSQGVYAYEGQGFLCLPRALPDTLSLRKQTPCWTCGATRFGRTLKTFFRTWRPWCNLAPWAPF